MVNSLKRAELFLLLYGPVNCAEGPKETVHVVFLGSFVNVFSLTNYDGKELVVCDVLQFGNDDATSFLVIKFVGFACSVFGVQSISYSIMFTEPHCVHDSYQRLFFHSAVT